MGREDQSLARTIKESIYIKMNKPSLNKNFCKYCLPHIWDDVLLNTLEVKIISPFVVSGYCVCHLGITSANMVHDKLLSHLPSIKINTAITKIQVAHLPQWPFYLPQFGTTSVNKTKWWLQHLPHSYNTPILIMVTITSVTTVGVLQIFIGHINTNTPKGLIVY